MCPQQASGRNPDEIEFFATIGCRTRRSTRC